MVSCISKGRYGNFSFANMAAFCYSLKYGLDFHIQDKTLASHMWPLYHQHLKNPNWNADLPAIYVNDEGHRYRELPFEESWRDKNIIIGTPDIQTGYFQSYKYLEGHEDQIRKAFFPGVTDLFEYNRCAVHIRRGDYVELEAKHPPITIEYLRKAINQMAAHKISMFDFYSDDIAWIKDSLCIMDRGIHNHLNYHFIEGTTEEDFISIMTAPNIITANSSFSVLAAILNLWPTKMVVCPHEDNYMGEENKHLDVTDLYPKEWIRIKY